jgi:hypothetical protein
MTKNKNEEDFDREIRVQKAESEKRKADSEHQKAEEILNREIRQIHDIVV